MGPVRVVIVHRDRPSVAAHAIERFLDGEVDARVTVVDCGSSSVSIAALRSAVGGSVDLIETGHNLGYGPGANVGLRRWMEETGEPWAIVAPHDAMPVDDCVAQVIAELEGRPAAALACAEYGPGEDFKPTIDKFFGASFVPSERGRGWETVDYAHGTLLAMRRDAVAAVGLFDERFFAYCEEADLSMRARAGGWDVGLVWDAVVTNGRPPRVDVARYLQLRNTLLLLEKHFGVGAVTARLAWELGVLVLGGASPTTGVGLGDAPRDPAAERKAVRRSTVLAVRDYLRRRFGPPPADVLVEVPAA